MDECVRTVIFPGVVLIHPADLAPYVGSPLSTGVDIRASVGVVIEPGSFAKVATGCTVEVDPHGGDFGSGSWPRTDLQMRPRSGFAARGVFGHVGTIDADYRGELFGLMFNLSGEHVAISRGERVYQLVCGFHVAPCSWVAAGDARQGGLGSTGVR